MRLFAASAFAFLISAGLAQAQFFPGGQTAQWESATNVGQKPTGDMMIIRCIYRTIGGYEFAINVRGGICPFQVSVNPETNQVRR